MIRLSLNREPVTISLTGAYVGVTVTLRRLTSVDYAIAQKAALAFLRDKGKVAELLERHDLVPPGYKGVIAVQADADFMAGLGIIVASVECGLRAITEWTGIHDEQGRSVPVSREALEYLFLDENFERQVSPEIDKAARLIATEGEPLGGAPRGSSVEETTASPPTTARAAGRQTSPAAGGSPTPKASSAPKSRSPRSRKKAQPSGA